MSVWLDVSSSSLWYVEHLEPRNRAREHVALLSPLPRKESWPTGDDGFKGHSRTCPFQTTNRRRSCCNTTGIAEARVFSPASQARLSGDQAPSPQKHSSMNQTPGTRLRLTALASGARQVEGIVVVAPRALGLRGRTYDLTSIGQPTSSRFSLCCMRMCTRMRISWVVC